MRLLVIHRDSVLTFAALLTALLAVASCSGRTDPAPECLDGPCHARCIDEGHSEGGYCQDGECRCVDGPGSDADVGDGDAESDMDTEAAPPRPEECLPGMVQIPDMGWCIDPYECSIDGAGRAISVAGGMPALEVSSDEAQAACEAIGKTLCPEDVWMAACTAGGAQTYPYGDTYEPNACNGQDVTPEEYKPAGAMPDCEGGHPGIFDMSGNAWELTVGVNSRGEPTFEAHGGDASGAAEHLTCEFSVRAVGGAMEGLGFRCCLQLAD